MKRILAALASVALASLLSACAAVGEPVPPASSAQIAAQVCPDVLIVTQAFAATPGALAPSDAAHLAAIQPVISRVCSAARPAEALDLRALASDAVPVLISAINGSNLPDAEKTRLVLAVNLTQALVIQKLPAAPAASASQ